MVMTAEGLRIWLGSRSDGLGLCNYVLIVTSSKKALTALRGVLDGRSSRTPMGSRSLPDAAMRDRASSRLGDFPPSGFKYTLRRFRSRSPADACGPAF